MHLREAVLLDMVVVVEGKQEGQCAQNMLVPHGVPMP